MNCSFLLRFIPSLCFRLRFLEPASNISCLLPLFIVMDSFSLSGFSSFLFLVPYSQTARQQSISLISTSSQPALNPVQPPFSPSSSMETVPSPPVTPSCQSKIILSVLIPLVTLDHSLPYSENSFLPVSSWPFSYMSALPCSLAFVVPPALSIWVLPKVSPSATI